MRDQPFSPCRLLARVGVLVAALGPAAALRAQSPITLRDATRSSGIAFRHTDGGHGRYYIVETVASGIATFDYDGDGGNDAYFLNGRPLRGTPPGAPVTNALYRNRGDFRFGDVTEQAGVGAAGYGLGVCVGDYDNDGFPDLYVNNYGPNVLYHNNGDGTFTDVTESAGVGRGDTVGAGANFLDIDGDGCLDLFVANYVRFTYDNHVTTLVRGKAWYPGPRDFPPQPNRLYRNRGDGTFADATASAGIGAHAGSGMGTIALDYDDDGDSDLFVCNDQALNFLFQNDGTGRFREVALETGVACNYAGEPVGSMGADAGDYDHDGRLDLFMTDFQRQKPILFHNLGPGGFEDATLKTGAAAGSFPYVKWGCGWADFDNDGWADIFLGCGHLGPGLDATADRTAYQVRPILLRNRGNGRFTDVSATSGDGMQVPVVARGIGFEDFDNDGRVDVLILSSRHDAVMLRNESRGGQHWLALDLRGVRRTNRDAVGARVRVTAGPLVQTAEVHSGRGYQSHFGSRLHFGLGAAERVGRLEVRWLGGAAEVWEHVPADRVLTLLEGTAPRAAGSGG